jgi:eukaryotic-like serine/threonine-protein kinase
MTIPSGQKPADELERLVGSIVLGKYRVERLIGRGGMGAVFQATHSGIGKRVALKFLAAASSRDAEATTRFQREAEAASLAESPHIVQIFDSGRSEQGLPFLVMELLSGEDLRARLRREGRLDTATALAITSQVLKALRAAHAAGIVHRDLKPDNVFLCRRDDEPAFVKLVDFGISKLQGAAGVDTLTHGGAVLGTAFYMSPEQAQSFPDIDGRTDLFSVGAMLYEMLTGEPPQSAPSYEAVLIAICTRDAPDVRDKAPSVPEGVARVIARALQRERSERYATAGDMLGALGQAHSAADAPPSNEGELDSPARRVQRYRGPALALGAAFSGLAVAAYVATRGGDSERVPPPPLPRAEPAAAPERAPAPARSAPEPPPPTAHELVPLAPPKAPTRSAAPPRLTPPEAAVAGKVTKKQTTPAPAGVASGLGLSTREP